MGPWAWAPQTGLWVISVLGMTWLHPSVALGQGPHLVAALMPEEADLGLGTWGRGLRAGVCSRSDRWLCAGQGTPMQRIWNVRPCSPLYSLIQAGCELNAQDHDGGPWLHAGCALGRKEPAPSWQRPSATWTSGTSW